MKLIKTIKVITISLIGLYLAACGFLYFSQRSLLYHPSKDLKPPASYDLAEISAVKIKTIDNLNLTSWFIAPKPNMQLILYFQGNAANLGNRANKFKNFINAGFGIMAPSYSGFGDSEGSPSEQVLYNNARAALSFLNDKNIEPENIICYGESLGTGVAAQMALENKCRFLVLEAPYDSIAAVAGDIYPMFPVSLLLIDKFASIEKIGKIKIPVLIFHSKDDKVIPIEHGIKLFNAANEPKKLMIFENSGHSNFNSNELTKIMLDFLATFNNNTNPGK